MNLPAKADVLITGGLRVVTIGSKEHCTLGLSIKDGAIQYFRPSRRVSFLNGLYVFGGDAVSFH